MYIRGSLRKPVVMVLTAAVIVTGLSTALFGNTVCAREKQKETTEYIIAQDGSGDFTTIQEGVDNADDGDTLIIYPGIYTENVEVMGKELNITGIDKDCCILQCDTSFYRTVPLTIAAGNVSNLTIFGMNSGVEQQNPTEEEIVQMNAELVGDSWERQKNYSGYAVHIDQNFLYGRQIGFRNCRIISQNNHCVGIGSRGDSGIIFEGCELIAMGGGGCIYLHDSTSTEVGGESKLMMRGCYLRSYLCPYVLTFQTYDPSNSIYLTFQDVHVSAVAYEDSESYRENNVSTSFDVRTLLLLERMGALHQTGLTSSVTTNLIHEIEMDAVYKYMEILEKSLETGDASEVMAVNLPEGITYIGLHDDMTINMDVKRQVIAVYNYDGQPGTGWCGLNNAYLTSDSYGNTLVEMNAVHVPSETNAQELTLAVQ